MKYKLKKILEKALDAFQKATGLNVDILDYEYDEAGYPDTFVRIAYGDEELDFAVDVSSTNGSVLYENRIFHAT